MKLLIVLALATWTSAKSFDSVLEGTTAYNYHSRYGIPLAEKIRKAEEENSQQRVVGGSPSALTQFPYQAGILANFHGLSGIGVCGGTLVSTTRVLTAAHCWNDGIFQAWVFTIVLGSTTLFSGGTRIQTSEVAMHPNWDPLLIHNDVAVAYLPFDIGLSEFINIAALPSGNELTMDFDGYFAVASGFGLTRTDGSISITSQYLSHVTLNIISKAACINAYPFNALESNICTSGAGGVGICGGDSGGPLVVTRNNRPVLVGITSFGSPYACEDGLPSAFARVTSFMDFFNQHM